MVLRARELIYTQFLPPNTSSVEYIYMYIVCVYSEKRFASVLLYGTLLTLSKLMMGEDPARVKPSPLPSL